MNDVVLAGAQVARHRWVRHGLAAPALTAGTNDRWPWCGGCMDQITKLAQFSTDDARALLPQWQAAMRAEAKNPCTIDTYTHGLCRYLAWCAR